MHRVFSLPLKTVTRKLSEVRTCVRTMNFLLPRLKPAMKPATATVHSLLHHEGNAQIAGKLDQPRQCVIEVRIAGQLRAEQGDPIISEAIDGPESDQCVQSCRELTHQR